MSSTYGSARGNVAARIQAFQDVQHLEGRSSRFAAAPRAMSQAREAGVTVGRGRREDSSFGSPAGRTSRDGTDGVRGDGRPAVGTFEPILHPSMERREKYRRPKIPTSFRPATSMANKSIQTTSTIGNDEELEKPIVRRYCSMENVRDETSEISGARSRLRSVARGSSPRPCGSRGRSGRAYTITELGDMINDAIEEQVGDVSAIHTSEASEAPPPEPPALRRRSSVRAARKSIEEAHESRRQSLSHSRKPRGSIELVEQNTSNATARTAYGEHALSRSAISPQKVENRSLSIGRDGYAPDRSRLAPSESDLATPNSIQKHPHPVNCASPSPVKQRAALFENLQNKPSPVEQECQAPHDRHLHVKKEWFVVPEHQPTPKIEHGLHNIKFGKTIHARLNNDLIPLALPQLVDSRRRSSKTSESSSRDTYKTARQSEDAEHNAEVATEPREAELKQESIRKASGQWPFKWNLFNKGNTAPPKETDNVVDSDPKDEHQPLSRPSFVKSKMQDLLAAASKRDYDKEARRRSDTMRAGRRKARDTAQVFESEMKEQSFSPALLKPAEVPPFQVPIEEQAGAFAEIVTTADSTESGDQKELASNHEVNEDKTPLRHLMTEKEVFGGPTNTAPLEVIRAGSPTKPAPGTPIRGRTTNSRPLMSPGGSQYAVEQRFTLSPGPSRSQSRASRGRMKVEIEVRESPEREARERGDKIVVIRANVEALEGSEENED